MMMMMLVHLTAEFSSATDMNVKASLMHSVHVALVICCWNRHETVSGYYRTSAYFLSKIFCDVMPQRVFPIIVFAIITYFMIGTCC